MTVDRKVRRHPRGVQPLDDLLPRIFTSKKIAELLPERRQHLVERGEGARVARLDADAPAGHRVDAVVQRDLEHLRQVEVAGQDVGFLAERPRLDAPAGAAGAGVLERLSLPHQLVDHEVGVEDRGLSPPLADDLAGALQESVGILLAQLDVRRRLEQPHLVDDVEHQVGDLVDAVARRRR